MRRSLFLVLALGVSACRCGNANVSSRFGELVVVQTGADRRELLLRDATVRVPSTFMDTLGAGEVPVRNVGVEEIAIASITRLDGDSSLSLDDAVGQVIAAQTDAVLAVRFSPGQADDATLAEVTHRAKFSVQLSGARPGEEELLIEVVAAAVARDCFVPALVDFGQVPLQQAIIAPVVLTNGRALPQSSTFGAFTGDDAFAFYSAVSGTTVELAAGASVDLAIRFAPLEERSYASSVSVRRGEGCPAGVMQVRGTGNDEALSWSPARLDFGRIPLGVAVTRQVKVVNRSKVALSLNALLPSADYTLPPGAPTVVPADGTATLEVSCTPQRLGPLDGLLTVELGTTPVTPARLPMTCVGGGPRVRVDPNPVQFGAVTIGQETRRRIIVQNVGTAPPAPGDTTNNLKLGVGGALPWFAVVAKNGFTSAAEFNVSLRGTYDAATGIPAISGQNFVEFEVALTPRTTGARDADLLVYSNDAATPVARVALTASPRLFEQCELTVTPESANFGPVPRGALLSRSITLTNVSNVASNTCLVSGIELAPGSNLAFQVTDPAVSSLLIPQGQSRTIRISAAVPGDAPLGDYLRGVLRLQVTGEPMPRALPVDLLVSQCLVVDPPLLDLGVVQSGCTSGAKTVSLYNVCGVPITLTGLSTPGAPFRVTSSPLGNGAVSLDPTQRLDVQVAAAPAASGSFVDALRVDSLEGGAPYSQNVALRAESNPSGLQTSTYVQTAQDVDILLVIDNSCSMADEQAALATNFASFITSASQSAGNWHIGIITTDVGQSGALRGTPRFLTPSTPGVTTLFAQQVQQGVFGSGIEQPFASMALAISATNRNTVNAGFIRPDAALAVVIVTDALEQSANSVGSYVALLRQLKGNRAEKVNVSVVGPFSPASPSCTTEGLVDDGRFTAIVTQTNGVKADICTADWASDLQAISASVFGARAGFELINTPRSTGDITVTIDGQPVTTGWTWDTARNLVVFTTPPAPGAMVNISYRTACF